MMAQKNPTTLQKKSMGAKASRRLGNTAAYIVLILITIIWLFPFVGIVLESFKVNTTAMDGEFWPGKFGVDNYIRLFTQTDFLKWFKNTAIMGIATAVLQTFFVLSMSYTLSRLRFKGRKALMNVMLILGMFPGFLTMILIYKVFSDLGLTMEMAPVGLIIVYCASSGMGYYIAKGFFDTIPTTLDEAALGDVVAHTGAGAVDDHQADGRILQSQTQVGEDLIDQDHGEEAREHAQDQHEVHQGLSGLETQTGRGVAHGQHEEGLEESSSQAHDSGVLEPLQEVGLRKQADIIVQAELFGEQLTVHCLGIDLEGFHYQAEEGEQPDDSNRDQNDIDDGVAQPSAGSGTEAGFLDLVFSFHHWKSSSFLVDGITLYTIRDSTAQTTKSRIPTTEAM